MNGSSGDDAHPLLLCATCQVRKNSPLLFVLRSAIHPLTNGCPFCSAPYPQLTLGGGGTQIKTFFFFFRFGVQVLPLSLSVDFLRLVLAVVDDHARSQGQVKTTTAAATAFTAAGCVGAGPAADAVSPGTAATAAASGSTATADGAVGKEGSKLAGAGAGVEEIGGVVHATAVCLLSVGDLPRLYNRPGAIIRNLFKACKGDKPTGVVSGLLVCLAHMLCSTVALQ